jgi:hypothetical protein
MYHKTSAGNFEIFEKNFGSKNSKSRYKYFEIHWFYILENYILGIFINILQFFRDLKIIEILISRFKLKSFEIFFSKLKFFFPNFKFSEIPSTT